MFSQLSRPKRKNNQAPQSESLTDRFPDIEPSQIEVFRNVKTATMTSPERVFALCNAVDYVCKFKIAGDITECGVWRGGSMMAVAEQLKFNNRHDRRLWLFDTFGGMPEPTEVDVDHNGSCARELMSSADPNDSNSIWCNSELEEVKSNLLSTGYPDALVNYVQGDVCETLRDNNNIPDKIAILRLDTDWYESTRAELEALFPRIVAGGVLIIDDYGHWGGCRKAVDEYFADNSIQILLHRIDYTGRIGIKQ